MFLPIILGLFCLVLLYQIKILNKINKELTKDAKRYWELRSWHWNDTKFVVAECKNLSVGTQTFSGTRLDELVDSAIYDKHMSSLDPADED